MMRRILLLTLTAILLLVSGPAIFGGCVPRTADVSLPVEPPETFSLTGSENTPDRWWRAFGDPQLNRLVDRALEGNFDLETAWHRLREA